MRSSKRVALIAVLALPLALGGCGDDDDGGGTQPPPPPPPPPPSADADIAELVISAGTLSPAFSPETTTYAAAMGLVPCSVTVSLTASDSGATITVNGMPVVSGAASSPVSLVPGPNTIKIVVRAADGVAQKSYVILAVVGVPERQEAYLKASNAGAGDKFGLAAAIDGDTIVVGAYYEDSNATGVNGNGADNSAGYSGAAYVFVRSGGVWTQEAYLKASNTEADDWFGSTVAIDGDTVVVGALNEDSSATGVGGDDADNGAPWSGAAYVFRRTGGAWSQEAYLKASTTDWGKGFGCSVAIEGDTIVVGADGDDSSATGVNGDDADEGATGSGAAYVFVRSGGVWSQQAYLKASNTEEGDGFGSAVAVDGDTIVIAAYYEDSNATGVDGNQADNSALSSGAAYVFTRTGGIWTNQAYLKASNTDVGDHFGQAVAIDGDSILVGAPEEANNGTGVNGDQDDNSAWRSGAAYVFTRTGGVWSQQAYLKASNTDADDWFGKAVAISGDTIVVGAYYEASSATGVNGDQADNSAARSGAAYVLARTDGVWSQQGYIKASNAEAPDGFGLGVAIDGDTIVVGAMGEGSGAMGVDGDEADNSAPVSGAAYVFR